jgi:WD40 repeat protein
VRIHAARFASGLARYAATICLAITACASSQAATPYLIRPTRVIHCEAEGDKRPTVVTGVSITPDGRNIAAATDDRCVTVWDATTAEMKGRFDGHTDWVHSVVLSADGNTVASGGDDRELRMWDLREHRCVMQLPAGATLAAVCFHPNTQQLAMVGFDNSLKIVNVSTGQLSQTLVCPCADTRTITFSPDGSRMAVAGRNGKIRVWNVNNGKQERDIETDGRRIRALAFSPDSQQLAAAGLSTSVRVFDVASGNSVMTLSTRPAKVYSMLFLSKDRLATGGTDNRVTIWDLDSQRTTNQLVGHTGTVAALACDATGNILVSGSYDTTLCIWNLVTRQPVPATARRTSAGDAR